MPFSGWQQEFQGLRVDTTVAGLNLYAGVATSGETGANVYSVTLTQKTWVSTILVDMRNCNGGFAGPVITIRVYSHAAGVEVKISEQAFTKGLTPGGGRYGGDPDAIPVLVGRTCFGGLLRLEIQSNYVSDVAVSIPVKIS